MTTGGEIVRRAKTFAERLFAESPNFKRSTFLGLIEGCRGDLEELRRRIELAEEGSGGHLDRSGSFEQQLEVLARVFREQWKGVEGLPPQEVESWLGWTARLLSVGEELKEETEAGGGRGKRRAPKSARSTGRSRLPGDKTPSDRKPVESGTFPSLSGNSALEEMMRRFEEEGE